MQTFIDRYIEQGVQHGMRRTGPMERTVRRRGAERPLRAAQITGDDAASRALRVVRDALKFAAVRSRVRLSHP